MNIKRLWPMILWGQVPKNEAELNERICFIREHPVEAFNSLSAVRQASLRRQARDHRSLQRFLHLPETWEVWEDPKAKWGE